jgi:hypothetical protein
MSVWWLRKGAILACCKDLIHGMKHQDHVSPRKGANSLPVV